MVNIPFSQLIQFPMRATRMTPMIIWVGPVLIIKGRVFLPQLATCPLFYPNTSFQRLEARKKTGLIAEFRGISLAKSSSSRRVHQQVRLKNHKGVLQPQHRGGKVSAYLILYNDISKRVRAFRWTRRRQEANSWKARMPGCMLSCDSQ